MIFKTPILLALILASVTHGSDNNKIENDTSTSESEEIAINKIQEGHETTATHESRLLEYNNNNLINALAAKDVLFKYLCRFLTSQDLGRLLRVNKSIFGFKEAFTIFMYIPIEVAGIEMNIRSLLEARDIVKAFKINGIPKTIEVWGYNADDEIGYQVTLDAKKFFSHGVEQGRDSISKIKEIDGSRYYMYNQINRTNQIDSFIIRFETLQALESNAVIDIDSKL